MSETTPVPALQAVSSIETHYDFVSCELVDMKTVSVMMRLGLREWTSEKRIRMFNVGMGEDVEREVRRRECVIRRVQTRQESITGWEGRG